MLQFSQPSVFSLLSGRNWLMWSRSLLGIILVIMLWEPRAMSQSIAPGNPSPLPSSTSEPSASEPSTPEVAGTSSPQASTTTPQKPPSWANLLSPIEARSITIKVGTYQQRPFVFWDGTQTYGYGIDLWQNIATALDVKTQFVQYENVSALLAALKAGKVDVAVSGISITAAREGGGFDFSYPIYRGGLQLLVRRQKLPAIVNLIQQAGGEATLYAVLKLVILSLVSGTLIWWMERDHYNSDFSSSFLPGIGQGMWFAIVTLGTFGYGDITPKTLKGRAVAAVWMAFSFFVLGDFIARMTAIHQAELEGTTLADLKDKVVGATLDTSAYPFLRNQPVQLKGFKTFADAVSALEKGEVDGVVGDYPTMKYLVSHQGDRFALAGPRLNRESYGMATAEGNEMLMEAIDRELLKLERSGQMERLETQWFGHSSP